MPMKVTAVQRIKDLYRLGVTSLDEQPAHSGYGTAARKAESQKRDIPLGRLFAARQFAARYSPKELHELCQLLERHPTSFFGIRHLTFLLPLKPRERSRWQRLAIEQGWGTVRLGAAIGPHSGQKKTSGRLVQIPKDRRGLLVELKARSKTWRRWLVSVSKAERVFASLPEVIQVEVKGASKSLGRLHALVAKELENGRMPRGKI
jgi:hypothetical protein